MAQLPLIALCKISHNWHGRFEATGRYDEFGNMIMLAKGESIEPGTLFEMEEGEELDRLRSLKAVRDPSEAEQALWERTR
jgi:hypothetical protein